MKLDGRVYLKIKIKSLAEEAKMIRKEEGKYHNKYHKPYLRDHRKKAVGQESRASLLAYAFLRGKTYASQEQKVKNPPDWERVKKLVGKYCHDVMGASFTAYHCKDLDRTQWIALDIAKIQREALISLEEWRRVNEST